MAEDSADPIHLQPRQANGGAVRRTPTGGWQLSIPAGPAGQYRWAQVDDYLQLPRAKFPWQPPLSLRLRARVSTDKLPGTWGFGFWNDPFSLSFGLSGMARRIPALPNCAWFFFASPHNYLALYDDHPARGFLAASFSSARIPSILLLPAAPVLPLLALPPLARLLRRAGRIFVREAAILVETEVTSWHSYRLDWQAGALSYWLDNRLIFHSPVSPRGPLGFVLWIDNQFAAFPPDGRVKMGTLPTPGDCGLEIEDLQIRH